jgi:hypothetical protein
MKGLSGLMPNLGAAAVAIETARRFREIENSESHAAAVAWYDAQLRMVERDQTPAWMLETMAGANKGPVLFCLLYPAAIAAALELLAVFA